MSDRAFAPHLVDLSEITPEIRESAKTAEDGSADCKCDILLRPVELPLAVYCYDELLTKKYEGLLTRSRETSEASKTGEVVQVSKMMLLLKPGAATEKLSLTLDIDSPEDKKLRNSLDSGWFQWKRADNHLPIATLSRQCLSVLQRNLVAE